MLSFRSYPVYVAPPPALFSPLLQQPPPPPRPPPPPHPYSPIRIKEAQFTGNDSGASITYFSSFFCYTVHQLLSADSLFIHFTSTYSSSITSFYPLGCFNTFCHLKLISSIFGSTFLFVHSHSFFRQLVESSSTLSELHLDSGG